MLEEVCFSWGFKRIRRGKLGAGSAGRTEDLGGVWIVDQGFVSGRRGFGTCWVNIDLACSSLHTKNE